MIAPTHLAFSLFFTLFGVTVIGYTLKVSVLAYVFGAIGAVLPDIDTPKSIIGRIFLPISKFLDRRFGHRTITHSLLGWLTVSLLASPLILWHKDYFLFFTLSYLSHLILDMSNIQGICLLWPDRRRDVLGKLAMRLPSGDFKEIFLIIVFIGLSILTLPLSHYGWKNSLGWLISDHQSAEQIYLRSTNQSYLEFSGINSITREPVQGKALILQRYGEKGFIVGWDGKVYTIGNTGEVDILSSQERIAYTNTKEQKTNLSFEVMSFSGILQKLSKASYIKGEITAPDIYDIQIPVSLSKRIQQSNHIINLIQATPAELKKIRFTKIEQVAESNAREGLSQAEQKFASVKKDLYNDGYTDLGRKKLGIDHASDQKYIDAQNAIVTARKQLQSILSGNSNNIWSATLEVR